MALLNKVIENKRDEYMISVLEEGTTELESLKTKKYLTENLHMIGKILMEEGVVDAAKANLANNWGKYAAGAGVVGAGAADQLLNDGNATNAMVQGVKDFGTGFADKSANPPEVFPGAMAAGATVGDTIDNFSKTITDNAGNIYDNAGNLLKKAGDAVQGAYGDTSNAVQGAYGDTSNAVQTGLENAKANVEANPAMYAAGAGALGGAALGAGALAANRATQKA